MFLKQPSCQENTETSIIQACALVLAHGFDNIDHQMRRIAQHIQSEWRLLPPHCINCKIALLQCMQQMCEVDEGLRIVRDIRTHKQDDMVHARIRALDYYRIFRSRVSLLDRFKA
jgi:hypothetical protein